MCTSKETQTHADKHFRLYTSFVPWRSCWFLVLKRPSNIADKHFNFTPIIIIWATRWQRHWNVCAFVVWDTTITDGKSSNFSFFMNYKFHIYKCLRKVCFLTDLSQKKHQISYSDLLCSLRSLFHAYLNPTLQKREGGDSDPQPLFLCHVVCGFPSRSLTPNFSRTSETHEQTLCSPFEAHFFAVTGRSGLTYVMCEQRRQPAQSELKAVNILRQVTGFNRPPKPPKWPRE